MTSCTEVSQPIAKSTETTKEWQTTFVRRQKHSYTQSGLLDSSYQVEEYYVNGQLGARTNFLVVRSYDSRNNLIKEKTFQLIDKKKVASEETLFEYDTKNNLIIKKNIFQNVLSEMSKFKYNELGQKVEEVKINKQPNIVPENWNVDSALVHQSDKKIYHYDTLRISYNYDENGNLARQLKKTTNNIDTLVTGFAKNSKTLTWDINSKGDTVSITKYQKDNNLIIEIRNDKMNKIYTDTTIYDESRKLQSVSINRIANYRHKITYKYDKKGNEIEFISFD